MKSNCYRVLVCAMVFSGIISLLSACPPRTNDTPFPLGINLSSFSYYSVALPFKNLFLQGGGWTVMEGCCDAVQGESFQLDQDGYVMSIPEGRWARRWLVLHQGGHYRSGGYVLLYDGEGEIKLGWDATNQEGGGGRITFTVDNPRDGIQIGIMSTNPDNYIRNIRVIHQDYEFDYMEQPFNPTWADLLRKFDVIRFMDWQNTSQNHNVLNTNVIQVTANSITLPETASALDDAYTGMVIILQGTSSWPRRLIAGYDGATRTIQLNTPINPDTTPVEAFITITDFKNRSWASRTRPNSIFQDASSGVAIEQMIALCNEVGASPWFCIPTAASDDYIRQFAELVKATLRTDLKVYLEYSNETWNFGWPGFHWSEAMGRELGIGGAWNYHAYRAVETFRIWNEVFEEADRHEDRRASGLESRLVRCLASQAAYVASGTSIMDFGDGRDGWPTFGRPASDFADALAVTFYFGDAIGASDVDSNGTEGLLQILHNTIESSMVMAEGSEYGFRVQDVLEARARGLVTVIYEAGPHVVVGGSSTDERNEKLFELNRSDGMKDVLLHALRSWEELGSDSRVGGVGVWCQYNGVQGYSVYGSWGMLESWDQPLETAPKYQAYKEFGGW